MASTRLQVLYIVTLVVCIAEFLSFSGIVYGWGALVYILKQENYFTDECVQSNTTTDNDTATSNASRYLEGSDETGGCGVSQGGCAQQDESLSLVFTISCFSLQGSAFLWGLIYDRLGTRWTRLLLNIFEVAGFLMIGFSSKETSVLVIPAMAALAAGGIAVLITNMQVSNLFGHRKSTIITGLSGCFDTSSSVMLFVKIAYEAGISLQTSFFILAGCTLLLTINTFTLLPAGHIPWPTPPGYTARGGKTIEADIPGQQDVMLDTVKEKAADEEDIKEASSMEVAEIARNADFPTLRSCLLSPLFILALLYVAILQLRMIFFLGTFNPWLEMLTECDQDTVSFYTTVFVFFQSTGLFMSPLCGLLVDRNKSKANMATRGPYADLQDTALVFAITSGLFGLFSIMLLIPVLEVQYVTFFLQVLSRSFLYSMAASAVPIFFPIRYFGTIYGLLLGLAGVFGLLQYPLFLLWKNFLNNDPFYLNVGFLLMCCLTFSLPVYITFHVKRKSGHVPIKSQ